MNKKVAIVLGTFILIAGGFFAFLALTIVNSKGCSQIVIDTNELHSGIDIPEVDFINCYFDERRKIRVSTYKLKLNDFHLAEYTSRFTLIDQSSFSEITRLAISEQPKSMKLYERAGTTSGDRWRYIVEPETQTLWVEIVYD